VRAGVSASKILTIPLGGPIPMNRAQLPSVASPIVKFLYAGPFSVRKGAHYLLDAWRDVAGAGTELHVYGRVLLPPARVMEAQAAPGGSAIVFHGSVSSAELTAAYRDASVLVFPTLCDGFGMVATEALANGLPVITTTNAGAADLIEERVNGLVIPPANRGALAAALQWAIDHPRELLAMRGAALDAAGRRTWATYREDFRTEIARALPLDTPQACQASVAVHA
jgi:glycosyltransferase involved in cell wall biosynthesis